MPLGGPGRTSSGAFRQAILRLQIDPGRGQIVGYGAPLDAHASGAEGLGKTAVDAAEIVSRLGVQHPLRRRPIMTVRTTFHLRAKIADQAQADREELAPMIRGQPFGTLRSIRRLAPDTPSIGDRSAARLAEIEL